jgi:hypothetical protein
MTMNLRRFEIELWYYEIVGSQTQAEVQSCLETKWAPESLWLYSCVIWDDPTVGVMPIHGVSFNLKLKVQELSDQSLYRLEIVQNSKHFWNPIPLSLRNKSLWMITI